MPGAEWVQQDVALLSLLLHAMLLTLQTLVVGGVVFLLVVRPADVEAVRRRVGWLAVALAVVGALYLAVDSAVLMVSAEIPLRGLLLADYFLAGAALIGLAVLLALLALLPRGLHTGGRVAMGVLALLLLMASMVTSHAVSRLEHRLLLSGLTLLHQGAAAAWLGGLAFLLMALRGMLAPGVERGSALGMLRRFSAMAAVSVVALAVTGVLLSVFYVGSAAALYGTAYGLTVMAKAVMLLLLLAVGATNFRLVRGHLGAAVLPVLRRVSEFELIAAFAVLLMTASLTSQSPGVDVVEDRVTGPEISAHFALRAPVLRHPALESLAPATTAEERRQNPDDAERVAAHTSGASDVAWSEFEHHWAGIFLVVIGILGVVAALSGGVWARLWPLLFIVMAVFLMVFSDPENWPLGPIGYWESFADPEVLLHRVALVSLMVFGVFEAGVQTGRLGVRAARVFPVLAIAAASGFLLHTHALGNVKAELLTEMSHTPLAVLGVLTGGFRLLELHLRADAERTGEDGLLPRVRAAAVAWPVCLMAAGCVLLIYREG